MSLRRSAESARTHLWAGLLVVVIVLLPPLVRATAHSLTASDSSSVRLNRGFDKPESKRALMAPLTHALDHASCELFALITPRPWSSQETLDPPIGDQHLRSVDPQRGPPSQRLS